MYLKNKDFSSFLPLLAFLPLAAFVLYPHFKYLLYACNTEWQEPFYLSALLALVTTTLLWCAHIPLDRLLLGANLFLIIAASFFVFNISPCLYVLGTYKGGIFFGCLLIVGILSTLATSSGFFAYRHGSLSQQKILSWILVAATGVMLVWSYVMSDYNTLITIVIPFIILRLIAEYLQYDVRINT